MNQKTAIIIGAGPAGLTAAYELLKRTDICPVVLESEYCVGGISRTEEYHGNRMDIGGHRFFSKSDVVMEWWKNIFPEEDGLIHTPESSDKLLLVRERLSRIFFLRRFFNYPVNLSLETVRKLGLWRLVKIGCSYTYITLFPRKPEQSLEDFFINRFGKELYETFFKDYTEKVWGTKCCRISADWGAQRVKGLSVSKAIGHAVKSIFKKNEDVGQKQVETSLIEKFLYPKYGPGQLWEEVARQIREKGGKVLLKHKVTELMTDVGKIKGVKVVDENGVPQIIEGQYFFSTMPVKELVEALDTEVPANLKRIAQGLIYRDFMTVGLLLDRMKITDRKKGYVPDTWIYIQERDVKLGRLQIFNNWSPYMVKDPEKVWVGLEYFVNEGDELWRMKDEDFIRFAVEELAHIGMIDKKDVRDSTLIRVKKAYPAYFGTYKELPQVIDYLEQFDNLWLIGRNGMHKYNNQDHSMLTAIAAVDNIVKGQKDKSNIWAVNTEATYHENKEA